MIVKGSRGKTVAVQRSLFRPGRGGARPGAGRKPKGLRAGVAHRPREEFGENLPLHVTVRLVDGLRGLRTRRAWNIVCDRLWALLARDGFRVCQFSVMDNHLHMVVEAVDRGALARGMQRLLSPLAKRLNALWQRSGRMFGDLFHARVLRTPAEVRNALLYVLNNARRHGIEFEGKQDSFASGGWFDGWLRRDRAPVWPDAERLVARARSWLLRIGWRRDGGGRVVDGPSLDAVPVGAV